MPDAYEQKMRQLEQLRAVLAQQEQQIRTLQQQPDLGLSVDPQVATSAQIAPQGLIAPAQGTEMFPAASTGIGSLAPIPPLREQIETYFQPPGDFLGNLAVDVPRTALEQVAFAEDIAHDPLGAGKEMAQGVAEAVRMLGAFQGIPEPTFQKERREQLGGREITRKSILEQMYDRPVGTTLQMLMPVLFSIGGAKLAGKAKIVKRLMDKGKPFKDATTIGMKAAGIKSPESAIAKWDAEITRQFEQQPTEVAAEAIGEAIQPKASQLRKQQRTLEVPQTSVSKTGFEAVYRGEGRASQKGGGHWSTDKEFARQFTQMGKESEVISSYIKRKDIYEFADPPYAGDAAAFDIAVAEAKAAGFKAVRLSEGLNQPTSLYVFDRSALKSTRVPELPKPKEAPDALQRQEAQAPAKAQAGEVKKLGYIDNLIEQYNAAGHVASRYRRSKQIDVDGRTMSNKDAIVKMRRVVTEQPKAKAQEVALPKIAEETGWMYKGVNKSGKHVFAHKKTGGTLVMDNIRGVRERLIKTGDKFTESVKNPVIIPKEFYKRKWSEVEAQWRQGKFGDVSPFEAHRQFKAAVKEAIEAGKIKSHADFPELPKPKEAPDALQRQEAQAPAKAQAGEVKKLGYIDNLIEQYNAAGHVASRYRRSKQIDVDGRTMSNKDAIVKMRRVVTEQPKAKAQEVALPKIAEETGWMYKGVNKSGKHVFAHKKTGGTLVMDNIRGVRERLIKTGDKFTESVKNPVIIPKEFYKRKWSEVEAQWRQGKFGDVSPYEAQRLHKIAVKEAIAEGKIKSHPDYPELGKPAKQPYEMTRGEFEADFFFHGKGEGHPTFGKRDITGGVTKKISEASGYAGRGKGEIHLIRKRDLAPGARQEMADILREQRALGNKKAKADHAVGQGFQPEGSIQSEIVIPGSVKYPHEYLIKQAIRENKPVPAEVLAEYPELVAKPTPKVEKGAVEPVTAKPTPEPPKAIGLKKTEIESIRKNTGLDQLDAAERRGWEEVLHKAKNEKVDQTILESADEIIRSGRQISDVEHAGMVVKAARLADEYDASIKTVNQLVEKGDVAAVKLENARAESMIAQMDKLTEASDVGGREAARALSIRRMMVNRETYDLAHIVQRAQAAKGRKLTTAERGKFEQMTSEHGRLQKQLKEVEANYDKLVVEREIANAEKVAATEVKKAKIESRKKVLREKIQIERGEIKKQLTEMGFRVNDITGVTAEGSYLVGKLAVNYIKDGAVSLDAVVQKVLADLPQLTKRDVYQSLITKDPKVQAKARAETFKRVGQLKTQARLLLEIEKVEKGVFEPTTATQRATQPVAIRQLQKKLRELRATAYKSNMSAARLEKAVKTINELQDQLANQYRSVKKGKPELTPDLAVAREKIKDLRKTMHVADELTKTQEQLRTGNFDIKVKPVEKPILPELERAQIQLKVNRKRIRTAIKDMEPMTAGKVGVEAINTARTLKATADMSAVMRQGLVLSVRRPIVAGKAFGKSFKAFFDKYTAEQIDNAIKSAPHHYIREKSGLQLMEVGGRVARGEEMFMSSVAEKIPLYGRVVKASERHMVSYLNMIRTAAFDQLLQKFPNATHAELTAWADFVNKASGRGNLGKFAGAANTLSLGFFAPRFAVSRIQTPLALFGKSSKGVTRRVRKEIAKDLVATASLGATALTLAHLAGAEVGTDPRSADWGKIKVGNTRIDIWGGMQQPMRVVARSGLGITDKLGLTGEDLTDWQKDVDPVELAARFSQYKFSPLITIPLELYKGKTIVGEDVTPSETAAKAAIPMVYEDMVDAWRLEGVGQSAWVGGLAFFGVGASTYSRKEGRENTIRKLLEEAAKATSRDARKSKESAAKSLQTKWNKLHPKDRINIL